MQQGNKPYPPFGAILNQMHLSNVKPNNSIFVYCGKHAWHCAKESNNNLVFALCLPPRSKADEYKWPVKGLSFIIINTGDMSEADLRLVAYSLLKADARNVAIFSGENIPTEVYHSEI